MPDAHAIGGMLQRPRKSSKRSIFFDFYHESVWRLGTHNFFVEGRLANWFSPFGLRLSLQTLCGIDQPDRTTVFNLTAQELDNAFAAITHHGFSTMLPEPPEWSVVAANWSSIEVQ